MGLGLAMVILCAGFKLKLSLYRFRMEDASLILSFLEQVLCRILSMRFRSACFDNETADPNVAKVSLRDPTDFGTNKKVLVREPFVAMVHSALAAGL